MVQDYSWEVDRGWIDIGKDSVCDLRVVAYFWYWSIASNWDSCHSLGLIKCVGYFWQVTALFNTIVLLTLRDIVEVIDDNSQPVYSGEVLLHITDFETFILGDREQPIINGGIFLERDIKIHWIKQSDTNTTNLDKQRISLIWAAITTIRVRS